MQQLYLTGEYASEIAMRLFDAMKVQPAGYRLRPLCVDGLARGDALHLLLPPTPPLCNDTPCHVMLRQGEMTLVPGVLEEVAAPSLLAARNVHTPMLMDGVRADMLKCPTFRNAMLTCLMGQRPVVVTAAADAIKPLTALTPPERQLWMSASSPDYGQLLQTLIAEAMMRF